MLSRKSGLFLLAVIFSVVFSAPLWAADSPKIGYFDLQTVLDQSKWGKQAKDDFKKEKDKISAEMDPLTKEIKTMKEEYDKKASLMDENAKKKKMKELQEKWAEREKTLMESNAKLNQLSNQLSAPIIDKILEIVKKIGKDDKYDYIFEAQKGGLVYAVDKDDLTKRIISELDKMTPAK